MSLLALLTVSHKLVLRAKKLDAMNNLHVVYRNMLLVCGMLCTFTYLLNLSLVIDKN